MDPYFSLIVYRLHPIADDPFLMAVNKSACEFSCDD